MRERFRPRRRMKMPLHKQLTFNLEHPSDLPRSIDRHPIKKALPWLFGVVVVGMMGYMLFSGLRNSNPMYLVFMVMMLVGLVQSVQVQGGNAEMSTAEVDSDRAEYLRYLSGMGEKIRQDGASQLALAQWSHPDPDLLDAVTTSPRLWERGASDDDYLKVRVGRDLVKRLSSIKVKPVESELDLEPVERTSLDHLRTVQQSIPHCPKSIDVHGLGLITIYGDRDLFAGAMRAWLAQLTAFHNPTNVAVAVVSPRLESRWGWTKWLPHAESVDDIDGAGPARFLGTSIREVEEALKPLLKVRDRVSDDKGIVDAAKVTKSHRQVVVIVDDPNADPSAVRRLSSHDCVTVIAYRADTGPDRDYMAGVRELILRVDTVDSGGRVQFHEWLNFQWKMFCPEPDLMDIPQVQHLARQMSRWDAGASAGLQDAESKAAQTQMSLLGITNAANINVQGLWKQRQLPVGTGEPIDLSLVLRVPLGIKPDGAPIWHDLKDEADGGAGPHGLMIGMTGSGKSTSLQSMVLGLFALHSPDVLQSILVDFKDGAGFDAFAGYPQVRAIITNLEEKRSQVERFSDTLYGVLDQRGEIFSELGRKYNGSAFAGLREYNEARATPAGKDLPPMPFMFIVVDEFSLLIEQHPKMVDVFDKVCRKGRSQGVYFLFASQTLDVGKVKSIPDNTQYRIGLKVASAAISRQVIGNEEAFHLAGGKDVKGTGFYVSAPGAEPVRFRGFRIPPGVYTPPTTIDRRIITADPRVRLFTAERVEPDDDQIIEEVHEGESAIAGPAKTLVLTIGEQLDKAYGKPLPPLWSPPLDDPIPLDKLLDEARQDRRPTDGPWWPWGEIDRPRQLTHELLRYSADEGNVSVLGMRADELTMVVQTFILSAASRYSPRDVGFYAMAYGGPGLAAIRDLPHLGAIGGKGRNELSQRIFGDLDRVIAHRKRMFEQHDIGSLAEFRQRRLDGARNGDRTLDDGYPTDIFVIIDGWGDFLEDNTSTLNPKNPHLKNVERLVSAGHGIHVLITASDWVKFGTQVQSNLNVHYELKLADASSSKARPAEHKMQRPQDTIPADQPGRGVTRTAEVIRFGVGRTDGNATMDGIDPAIRQTVAGIVAMCEKHGAERVPAPKLLPRTIDAGKLRAAIELTGEQRVLGLRGSDLQPLVVDMATSPLLGVYGDDGYGKTSTLRALLRDVVAQRRGPDEAMVMVFDSTRGLSDETVNLIEGEDYYETDAASMAQRLEQLSQILESRTPPEGLGFAAKREWTFTGPTVYLFIDNLHMIPASIQLHAVAGSGGARQVQVWQPLVRHLAKARDIGLRVIVSNLAVGVSSAEMMQNTVPGVFDAQNATRILLNSDAAAQKSGGIKFESGLAPGRGIVVAANDLRGTYVQLAEPSSEVLPPC